MSQNNADHRPNATAGELPSCAQDDSSLSPIPYSPSPIPSPPSSIPSPLFLRRADQAVLGVFVLSALTAMALWWLVQGGWQNRLIEIDQAQPSMVRFQVDINNADWPELIQLPGIGDTLAQRIIESRQSDGRFTKQDDLLRVRGIGPIIMERLRPYLLPLPDDNKLASEKN